jgi:ABC-type phosphate/phosphonate transport system substrate-binding protein
MPRCRALACVLGVLLLACAAGCQTTGFNFLSLIGLEKKPISVALVVDRPTDAAARALDPFPTYAPLQQAMNDDLGRPVAVDICFPFQLLSGFRTDWYQMAVVSPAQFATLSESLDARPIVASVDAQGRAARAAVLVVPAGSAWQAPADLRGKVVAFGPENDSRTHWAGLLLLKDAGLSVTDLSLELLPVPGSLKHLPDGRSVAQTVANGTAQAGFIDEADWEQLPAQAHADEIARDRLRVIGRTIALPSRVFIGAPKLDDATFSKLREFFVGICARRPEVLQQLTASGFIVPPDDMLETCRRLANVIAPPASQ